MQGVESFVAIQLDLTMWTGLAFFAAAPGSAFLSQP